MTALRAKWTEMNRYRRVLLIAMAAEILAFFVPVLVAVNRPGLEYGGTLLYPRMEGEIQIYEGTIDGEPARFAVSPEGEVSYRWGEYTYGPWRVAEDPAAAPGEGSGLTGVEITREGRVVFRGGYDPDSTVSLFREDGTPVLGAEFHITAGEGIVVEADGRVLTQEELHEPGLSAVARAALGAELTHRGSILLYLLITLLALLNVLQICFPGFFFRLSLWGHVRNIEDAEPSDWYIVMEKIEWAVLAVCCLFLYWQAATVIL